MENLFSNTNPIHLEPGSLASANFSGWVWECDEQGCFTYCSPEVEFALGLSSKTFLAQNLLTYRLSATSGARLAEIFLSCDYPQCAAVEYQHQNGVYIPSYLYLLGFGNNENGQKTLRGFTQLQATQDDQALDPAVKQASKISPEIPGGMSSKAVQDVREPTRDAYQLCKIASRLILEMLKHLKEKEPVIQEARHSRILISSMPILPGDAFTEPILFHSFSENEAAYEPIDGTTSCEQRLEWGDKLALTPEEKDFIFDNLYLEKKLTGKLRLPFTAKTIIKVDKAWIGVRIVAGEKKLATIVVSYAHPQSSIDAFPLEAFIADPLILMPTLRRAIENPNRTKELARRGEDYLIPR